VRIRRSSIARRSSFTLEFMEEWCQPCAGPYEPLVAKG
jgi:hypothetical protein